jgi:hypothetical protein
MKTRIEVLVDIDIPQEHIERMRKNLEDQAWYIVNTYYGFYRTPRGPEVFVQANEVAIPLPTNGTREDYVEYKESQARCTSM